MRILRILFKILLFPISLVLTVIVAFSSFIIVQCAAILNIISGLLFLGALLCYAQYFFGFPYGSAWETHELVTAVTITVTAFIISPYGLPSLVMRAVDKLDDLNLAIKSI
jgi:hypothetical protein